ncbi:MAG: twin transmembrane helix small protein [Brevundimonas sp.]|uniref:twin transmembrane helix small protein n=1 Tax=Brevundimonas sp. TaxID=1871086 RepID=UPI0027334BB4|nr:twin transmembrane helix small protein [Brevundimonas sp.]MBX9615524.1 twin transmembrane helix small protein [Caulobacteraceae bacterium]MDP3404971.1 twin transmembrane helix small protein [Brevundimonas sp.]
MMTVFDILILVAVAAVAIVLGFGLYALFRGGAYARSNSNRLMRLRVGVQAIAVVLLMAGLWWKSTHGG